MALETYGFCPPEKVKYTKKSLKKVSPVQPKPKQQVKTHPKVKSLKEKNDIKSNKLGFQGVW